MHPSQAFCTVNANEVNQAVTFTTRNVCITFYVDSFNYATVFDNLVKHFEVGIFNSVNHIDEFHTKTKVRFVAAITIHSFIPSQTLERSLDFFAESAFEDVSNQAFHQFEDFVHFHEGHFHVQLGEFGLTVSTQVFVTEATCDLEVSFHTGNHQKLFEDLRRLGKCIEFAGVYTAGNQIVACAFRSGFGEHRGFDFKEVTGIQVIAHQFGYFMTENDVTLHFRTTEIQVTIFQAQVFIGVDVVLNVERRSFSSIQYFDFFCHYFDSTGSNVSVNSCFVAESHFTGNFDYVFVADVFCNFEASTCSVRVSYNLYDTATVAQVNENQSTMVTAFCYPTTQYYLLTCQVFAKFATVMATFCFNHNLTPLLVV